MVEPDEFIPVTRRKSRFQPAIAAQKGQAIPINLVDAPVVSTSSQYENIVVTFILPSGNSEAASNVHNTTATTNTKFHPKPRILEVLQLIRSVVPNGVFSSSKTPNLTIHHRDIDPQTANDIEAFCHKILYPLPNGSGLGKVRMFFSITTAINEGIHSIVQHHITQQVAETQKDAPTQIQSYPNQGKKQWHSWRSSTNSDCTAQHIRFPSTVWPLIRNTATTANPYADEWIPPMYQAVRNQIARTATRRGLQDIRQFFQNNATQGNPASGTQDNGTQQQATNPIPNISTTPGSTRTQLQNSASVAPADIAPLAKPQIQTQETQPQTTTQTQDCLGTTSRRIQTTLAKWRQVPTSEPGNPAHTPRTSKWKYPEL
jgi:hypothetical protein